MKSKFTFWRAYLIFLAVLAVLVAAATLYVRSVLRDYEQSQPEAYVRQAAAQLAAQAADGSLWEIYGLSDAQPGRFEEGQDLKAGYAALLAGDDLAVVKQTARRTDGHTCYTVNYNGLPLAQVELRPVGSPVTRLAILTYQEWAVASVLPHFQARDYTLTLPAGFTVRANGVALTDGDGAQDSAGGRVYTLSGIYLLPRLEIADPQGAPVDYTLKEDKILPNLYYYSLTLPASLTVTLDGAVHRGEPLDSGLVRHDIAQLAKPELTVADRFGNTVAYEGENTLPLTYMTITADSRYTVQVNSQTIQPDSTGEMADYAHFAQYVPDLPQSAVYDVAILQDDASVLVTDGQGAAVELEPGLHAYDLTTRKTGLDEVPQEIAALMDAMDVAQKWSLFMSNDLSFSRLAPALLRDSYQYQMAYRYSRSVDITFTSPHVLLNPAFTDAALSNFTWLADTCFSVDISFVKHMRLNSGLKVDDPMNDRFYFVFYDDTDDGLDNAAWKLAGIKEIVNNAG